MEEFVYNSKCYWRIFIRFTGKGQLRIDKILGDLGLRDRGESQGQMYTMDRHQAEVCVLLRAAIIVVLLFCMKNIRLQLNSTTWHTLTYPHKCRRKHTCDTVAMYLLRVVDLIRSGYFRPGHSVAMSLSSLFPVSGVSAFSLANTYGFVVGTCTSPLVCIRTSTAFLQSGGSKINASTFFRDFPAAITISILKEM